MKWKENIQQQRKQKQEKEEEKKKPHSSSRFSISNLLPLSWFSKLKLNRSTKGQHSFGPSPRSSNLNAYAQPLERRPPQSNSTTASAYLSNSAADVDRFPPHIPNSPRRLSLREEEGRSLRPQLKHENGVRRWHHQSLSDLEFTTLGHLVPFSAIWSSPHSAIWSSPHSDTSTDGSADSDMKLGAWPATRLRPRKKRNKISRQAEDPRRPSCSGKVRRRPKAKVRVCSPRPSAVRVEEGLGITKPAPTVTVAAKRRRRRTAAADEEFKKLERFAVVKSSRDPQRDFRESMMEIIWEKGIDRPEELERLLACYLALNSDEHHDVIIEVFRQLWFELSRTEIPAGLQIKSIARRLDQPVR